MRGAGCGLVLGWGRARGGRRKEGGSESQKGIRGIFFFIIKVYLENTLHSLQKSSTHSSLLKNVYVKQ